MSSTQLKPVLPKHFLKLSRASDLGPIYMHESFRPAGRKLSCDELSVPGNFLAAKNMPLGQKKNGAGWTISSWAGSVCRGRDGFCLRFPM